MTEQLKPRKRVLDFIADAFDMFFGGQELHRARNALTPPPPPKEQPMNLDDYIFKCPTCYDSQQVRVPALHGYKPCPDCTMPEPPRCRAPKRETPTPFDDITPGMLAGAGGSKQTYPHEHRCPGCYISKPCNSACSIEPDQSDWQRERLVRSRGAVAVCDACSAEKQETVEAPQPEQPARYEMRDCPSPSDAAIMERLTKLTREHWAWNGEPVRMLAATDPPTLRDITADELETMGLRLRASQPEPPPTVSGESIPPVLKSLYDAVEGLPRLRDQLHSVERVNMPCMQGGLDLRDAAMQKIASALAYLWHAAQNEMDITPEIDLMVQAITVLQGVKR